MPNYKELYFMLFNKMADLIEEMKAIQQEAEEKVISSEELDATNP